MLLGFSTGSLYKTHDRLSPETFDIFRKIGANAIEIMWYEGLEAADRLLAIEPENLSGFNYVSLHAPSFETYSNEEIVKTLEILLKFQEKIKLDAIVVAPYEAMNWDIFKQFDLPFVIENMDWRKEIGKYVESLQDIFSKFDVPLALDVNHCFNNDPTMHLAYDIIDAFPGRIKEIQVSGFQQYHEPLFQTQQKEILEAIPDKNLPIIIESTCETIEDVQKEFEYVKGFVNV